MSKTSKKVVCRLCGGKVCRRSCCKEFGEVCWRCYNKLWEERREKTRRDDRSADHPEVRKWWKFVCKKDAYDRSVRICATTNDCSYYNHLMKRVVLDLGCDYLCENGKIVFKLNGYFRMLKGHYWIPPNGVSGVFDKDGNSNLAQQFQRKLSEGRKKYEDILWERNRAAFRKEQDERLEKLRSPNRYVIEFLENERIEKQKRKEAIRLEKQEAREKKKAAKKERKQFNLSRDSTTAFFQLLNSAAQISRIETTTKKQKTA
jgi:hypothetical protein